jgi:hypothetical protein
MKSVLSAKFAMLIHFYSVRIIFLVFHGIVVALLALGASECNFNSHLTAPPSFIKVLVLPHKFYGHKKINP